MRLLLNITKRENYMFMDTESKAFLSIGNPVCVIDKPSKAVLQGIKHETLIDIDEVSGIEISAEHKAVHDKLIRKMNLARTNKEAEAAAKKEALEEGKNAIEQLIDAANTTKETKSKKTTKSKKEGE